MFYAGAVLLNYVELYTVSINYVKLYKTELNNIPVRV